VVHFNKVTYQDLTLVVWLGLTLEVFEEVLPSAFANLHKKLVKNLVRFVLVNLVVDITVVCSLLGWLDAVGVLACVDLFLVLYVLSEVEALSWKKFCSDGDLEVLVGYGSVLVVVKLIEYLFELVLGYVKSPEVKLVLQFFRLYSVRFVEVQVHECFAQGLPLGLYFVHYLLFYVILQKTLASLHFVAICLVFNVLLLHNFEDGILDRVVPEVETFTHVDGATEPFGEVVVANLTLVL
jgi:hypothetical protein